MLHELLLYSQVDQLYIYIHMHICIKILFFFFGFSSHLGHHRVL